MAHYTFLPVYKASYELLLAVFQCGRNCAREYKYTIVERLKNEAIGLIVVIYRANSTSQKAAVIQTARDKIEVIRLLMRLLQDLKQISVRRFVHVNEQIESVSKQLSAWQKASS